MDLANIVPGLDHYASLTIVAKDAALPIAYVAYRFLRKKTKETVAKIVKEVRDELASK